MMDGTLIKYLVVNEIPFMLNFDLFLKERQNLCQ